MCAGPTLSAAEASTERILACGRVDMTRPAYRVSGGQAISSQYLACPVTWVPQIAAAQLTADALERQPSAVSICEELLPFEQTIISPRMGCIGRVAQESASCKMLAKRNREIDGLHAVSFVKELHCVSRVAEESQETLLMYKRTLLLFKGTILHNANVRVDSLNRKVLQWHPTQRVTAAVLLDKSVVHKHGSTMYRSEQPPITSLVYISTIRFSAAAERDSYYLIMFSSSWILYSMKHGR